MTFRNKKKHRGAKFKEQKKPKLRQILNLKKKNFKKKLTIK